MAITENAFFLGGFVALALHTIVYLAALRRHLRTEAAIFVYHLLLALALFACSIIFVATSATDNRIATVVALISFNGIYSLTFLELWTLSQISYSREVLIQAKTGNLRSSSSHAEDLVSLGNIKRSGRLQSLCDMGMLVATNDGWMLSGRGKLVAALLQLLVWIPNLRARG